MQRFVRQEGPWQECGIESRPLGQEQKERGMGEWYQIRLRARWEPVQTGPCGTR